MTTTIEWTEATCSGSDVEDLNQGAVDDPVLFGQAVPMDGVQARRPKCGVLVSLRAVARPARRHEVPGHRLAAPGDRDEVVESDGGRIAVGASFGETLLSPPVGNTSHPLAGPPTSPTRIGGGVAALSLAQVRMTERVLRSGQISDREPPAAFPAPCESHGSHVSTIGDARRVPGRRAPASQAGRRPAVAARTVLSKAIERVPGRAPVAPLQPSGTLLPVRLNADADSFGGRSLCPCRCASHALHSRGKDDS